jgi:hypothetical protein
MGAIVSLDYSAMEEAYIKANMAVGKCESYAKKIDSKINQKISDLKLGGNTNTSQADYFARQKISQLNEKKKTYSTYSAKMKEARTFAKDTDANVATNIKNAFNDFRDANDMKVGVISEFFAWATTTLLNSTAFGRWLNQICKDVGTWIDSAKRKFKSWYELDNGKYILKTVRTAIATVVAAILLVCVAWPILLDIIGTILAAGLTGITGAMIWTLITAAAGFATAVLKVVDGFAKYGSSLAAAAWFSDDPGWAKRYSSYSSLSEYLRKNNFNSPFMDKISGIMANGLDGVKIVADIINVADIIQNGIKKGVELVKLIKEGKMANIFNKISFKSPSGKVTVETVKHGIKNIIRQSGELKKKLTSTNMSRLKTYYEDAAKIHNYKKALNSGQNIIKLVETIGDKGVAGVISEKIKNKVTGNSFVELMKEIKKYHNEQKPSYSVL